jgi:hypothetical protein
MMENTLGQVDEKAAAARQEIERLAKEKAVAEVRVVESMEIGKVVRQGDVYIHCVSPKHPHGEKTKTHQLAIGDSMGSRHVAGAPAEVFEGTELPKYCLPWTFMGPCIVAPDRFTVTHPEHAHVSLPAGTYQVTHQMDAKTGARVID